MKNSAQSEISIQDIYQAQQRIAPHIRRTPLLHCLDQIHKPNAQVALKLENLQITGSFKIRGATNKLLSLSEDERNHGVITVSSGNHGRAVSYAARKLGIRAVVCLPKTVPQNKVEAIQCLGAEVIVKGSTYDEADAHAYSLRKEKDYTFIHPFDDPEVISGQGTIGLELLEDFPEVDTVIVPLSGGGLLSGIALALKTTRPELHVVGASMERGPAMVESLKAGKVVEIVEEPTLADALAGGIGFDNRYTFRMIQQLVDETVLVSEEEIALAMGYVMQNEHLVIEGGGAVGLAAVLNEKVHKLGKNIAVVISGGNVEIPLLFKVYQETERKLK